MLRQICYLSTATGEVPDSELVALLYTSERNNATARVSGLLAYGGGLFFQVLEGPRDSVGATLQRIRRDPRHADLRILQDEAIASRDFEDWQMAYRELDPAMAQQVSATASLDAALIPTILAGLLSPLLPAGARTLEQAVAA